MTVLLPSFACCSCPYLVEHCTTFHPLRGNDPWASAVALRPVQQQQQQTQIPFWPQQHQGSEMRLQHTINKTEVFCGCSRFLLCKRVVRVPPTAGSPASPSVPSCSAAQPPETQTSVGRRASACGTSQPNNNQNRIFHWSNFSLFRLLESRARKLSE